MQTENKLSLWTVIQVQNKQNLISNETFTSEGKQYKSIFVDLCHFVRLTFQLFPRFTQIRKKHLLHMRPAAEIVSKD